MDDRVEQGGIGWDGIEPSRWTGCCVSEAALLSMKSGRVSLAGAMVIVRGSRQADGQAGGRAGDAVARQGRFGLRRCRVVSCRAADVVRKVGGEVESALDGARASWGL